MGMSEEGYSMVAMDTMPASQESNGPTGGYSPPSDGEGAGQITSDEELYVCMFLWGVITSSHARLLQGSRRWRES